MCWSWRVSLLFASMEWLATSYLFKRNLPRDRNYGIFLLGIATMESLQMLLWLSIDSKAQAANKLFSLLLWLDAWLVIPLSIVNFVPRGTLQLGCIVYFFAQAALVLAAQAMTSVWTTTVGPNHHQVWPCAASLGHLGGHKLCVSLCLSYVLVLALAIQPLSKVECRMFLAIGAATFIPTYSMLGATMEACSVWCWSAGSYSIYFLARPKLHSIEGAEPAGGDNKIGATSSA